MSKNARLELATCIVAILLLSVPLISKLFAAGGHLQPGPSWTAERLAVFYAENQSEMLRKGMVFVIFSAGWAVWAGVIYIAMRKIEMRERIAPVLSMTQVIASASNLALTLAIPSYYMVTLGYRTWSPEITQLLNDQLGFVTWWMLLPWMIQPLAMGVCYLMDSSERPLFPRWMGYWNLIYPAISAPALAMPFFKTGSWAWDGTYMSSVQLPLASVWIYSNLFFLVRAILRDVPYEQPAPQAMASSSASLVSPTMKIWLAPLLLVLALPALSKAESDVAPWDVNRNPDCGKTGLTRDQKIERSLNMARLYHANYMTAVNRLSDKPLIKMHSCFAPERQTHFRMFDPKGEHDAELRGQIAQMTGKRKPGADFLGAEWRVFLKGIPDFAALPESKGGFHALPAENGVAFMLVMEGHTKEGKTITYPEINFWKINDAGQVTDWITTSDGIAVQDMLRAVFNEPHLEVKGMPVTEYFRRLLTAIQRDQAPVP